MPRLFHGTTRWRACCIILEGPRPDYREPGEPRYDTSGDGFSTFLDGYTPDEIGGHGSAEEYARGKRDKFPNQGGAVVLGFDVTDDIIEAALGEDFGQAEGVIQFDKWSGLAELLAVWWELDFTIRVVD